MSEENTTTVPLRELFLWRESLVHSSQVAHSEYPEDQFLHDRTCGGVSICDRIIAGIEAHLLEADFDLGPNANPPPSQ
jgi:hypothetical protein